VRLYFSVAFLVPDYRSIDDIEDNSQLRRGLPGTSFAITFLHVETHFPPLFRCQVAHKIYGVPQTINSANYVYFLAFQEILVLKAKGNAPDDVQNRLFSERDMDQIVTSAYAQLHLWMRC
jgi:geranylgeranyl diphosphate synthase type 3